MSKQTVSNEYVSAFCLEMSLLLHAGIGIEDGLYLLIEDEKAVDVADSQCPSVSVYIDDFDVSNFSCAAC